MSELFEDSDFPATLESVFYDGRADPGIQWKRPKDICSAPVFISDGATTCDIAQGNLSDCWFLSAAAVLSTSQDLFNKIVPPDQDFRDNYNGKFRFRFWRYGTWEEVVVDDRLPTRNNKLYFCYNRSNKNEFWSALLEKAYAKLHRSYQALEFGYGQDALVDLTGGVGEFIDLNGSIGVKNTETGALQAGAVNKLFKRLNRLTKKQCTFMCASLSVDTEGKFEDILDNGLVTGHAYSICTVQEVSVAGDPVCLIQLRNPWGYKEWQGAWGDSSADWDRLDADTKAQLLQDKKDDGQFWMSFDDFVKAFSNISLCHMTPDSVHSNYSQSLWSHADFHGLWIKGATAGGCMQNPASYWINPQYFVRLQDPDDDEDNKCTLVVSLMQKYTRVRKTVEKTKDTEAAIGFDIFKYKGRSPTELTGFTAKQSALQISCPMYDFDFLRERTKRFELEPGTYCIVPSTYQANTEGAFILRLAFESPAETGEVEGPTGIDNSTAPVQFSKLYDKHVGDDDVIDARELRKLLNEGVKRETDEEFSKETCRAIIKSIVGDHSGKLAKSDMEKVWQKVNEYQEIFDKYDKDGSHTLDIRELRNALKSVGVTMNKQTLAEVAQRYCGSSDSLSLDDFVLIVTKVTATSEVFENRRARSGSNRKVELSLDEVLQMTI